MWDNDDAYQGGGGGGFDNTTNMFESPQAEAKSSKPRCIAPVTIQQVLRAPEEGLKIKDINIQVVQIIAIVKAIEVTTIKITYTVEDNTGSIMGVSYLEGDGSNTNVPVVENTYCNMVGSVRSQGGEKHIMIFSIYPVTDLMAITEHQLAVLHMNLKAEQLNSMVGNKAMKQEMLSSYGGDSGHKSELHSFDMDPKYKRVYETITRSTSELGVNIEQVQATLKGSMASSEIRAAIDYLVGEGHIFTTIDDNHYKSTDSAF